MASDYFTKWVEAYAIPNTKRRLPWQRSWWMNFSVASLYPIEQLHSDQGCQFESGVLQEVFRLLKIYKSRTTPYRPQSAGLVERFNRTLISMLATTVHDNPIDWESHLKKVCMAYNMQLSIPLPDSHRSMYLTFGRQAKATSRHRIWLRSYRGRVAPQVCKEIEANLRTCLQYCPRTCRHCS